MSIKISWGRLLCMKEAKPIKEISSDSLPFSFLKTDIDEKKIKAHWKKIKEKIEKESSESTDTETDK